MRDIKKQENDVQCLALKQNVYFQSTDPYTNWDVNEPSSAAVATCAYVDKTKTNLPWSASCLVAILFVKKLMDFSQIAFSHRVECAENSN